MPTPLKIPDREERRIVSEKYSKGMSMPLLAKEYNVSPASIKLILNEYGVPVLKRDTNLRKTIRVFNESGLGVKDIAGKTGQSPESVRAILHKMGLKSNRKFHRTKHSLNDSYFEKIDNERKAYYLGLLYADGNVNNDNHGRNGISILLKKSDINVLQLFKEDISYTGEIRDRVFVDKNWSTQSILSFSSQKMKNDLFALGCTPAKSLTLKMPSIPSEFMHHFIRGYFDGDGCVYVGKRKARGVYYPICNITICGSYDFCVGLRDKLKELYDIRSLVRDEDKSIQILILCAKKDVIAFLEKIYEGATIFIKRKKEKFDTWRHSFR